MEELLLVVVGRQNDDAHIGELGFHLTRNEETILGGKVDIHQDNVRW